MGLMLNPGNFQSILWVPRPAFGFLTRVSMSLAVTITTHPEPSGGHTPPWAAEGGAYLSRWEAVFLVYLGRDGKQLLLSKVPAGLTQHLVCLGQVHGLVDSV